MKAADAELERVLASDDDLKRLKDDKAKLEAEARGESATLFQARIDRLNYRTDGERFAELERQQEKAHRQQLMAAQLPGRLAEIRDMTEPSDLLGAYEDVLLTNDVRSITTMGGAVLRRLNRKPHRCRTPAGPADPDAAPAANSPCRVGPTPSLRHGPTASGGTRALRDESGGCGMHTAIR